MVLGGLPDGAHVMLGILCMPSGKFVRSADSCPVRGARIEEGIQNVLCAERPRGISYPRHVFAVNVRYCTNGTIIVSSSARAHRATSRRGTRAASR